MVFVVFGLVRGLSEGEVAQDSSSALLHNIAAELVLMPKREGKKERKHALLLDWTSPSEKSF